MKLQLNKTSCTNTGKSHALEGRCCAAFKRFAKHGFGLSLLPNRIHATSPRKQMGGSLQKIELKDKGKVKIIKAVLLIFLSIITATSCNGNAPIEQASPTQVMGTAISLAWTEVSKTQPAIPTESVWKYEYIATAPIASVNNSTQEEIASLLFTQWLNHFKTEEADLDHKLEDFELLSVSIYEKQLPDDFVAMVTFSVKPTKMSSWIAGNGISPDGVWVRKKLLFISVKKENDVYSLVSMGTGP